MKRLLWTICALAILPVQMPAENPPEAASGDGHANQPTHWITEDLNRSARVWIEPFGHVQQQRERGAEIPFGTRVTLIEKRIDLREYQKSSCKVSWGNEPFTGWIYCGEMAPISQKEKIRILRITADSLNVRQNPERSAAVIKQLPRGLLLRQFSFTGVTETIDGKGGEWIKVEHPLNGYIFSPYTSDEGKQYVTVQQTDYSRPVTMKPGSITIDGKEYRITSNTLQFSFINCRAIEFLRGPSIQSGGQSPVLFLRKGSPDVVPIDSFDVCGI